MCKSGERHTEESRCETIPDPNLDAFRKVFFEAFAEACHVLRLRKLGMPLLIRKLKGKRMTDRWVGRRIRLKMTYGRLLPHNQEIMAGNFDLAVKCNDYAYFRKGRDLPPGAVGDVVRQMERDRDARRDRVVAVLSDPLGAAAKGLREAWGNRREKPGSREEDGSQEHS